jgi:hypothetical protein
MKQTAVQWLVEQIFENHTIEWQKQIEQALEMEKNQSIKFGKIVADKWGMIPIPLENIKDKYNETFKSE